MTNEMRTAIRAARNEKVRLMACAGTVHIRAENRNMPTVPKHGSFGMVGTGPLLRRIPAPTIYAGENVYNGGTE